MLQNTRERTVFAFQPKRLPKDVDRLRFFQGSIVRKKSVGTRGDTDDEEEEAAKVRNSERDGGQASELPEQPARVFRSASVNDLRTTVRKQRESGESEGIEGRSAKDPSPRRLHACVSMSSLPSARRSEVPPPLPAFPGAWKIQASVAGSQNDRASSAREVKPPSGQKSAVAAAGKALFAAALEERQPSQRDGMLRSPSMPLPRRPSAPREKRRPRPQRASEEVYEVESTACESGASPSSGGTSSRAAGSPPEAQAEAGLEVQKDECQERADETLLSTSASSQDPPQVFRQPPLPPPLPAVPPVPLRRAECTGGYSAAALVEAASAQAALLSPAPSARRTSGCE